MKKKNFKLFLKLYFNQLIPEDKKNSMPSFSQAIDINLFLKKNKKIFNIKFFEKNKNKFQAQLTNLEKKILIEYYLSKKVTKRLNKITNKI